MPELVGCEKLGFSLTLGVSPDGSGGSTPTGLNVEEHVPQESALNPVGLAEADVKNITVALPVGVQISPAAGRVAGLLPSAGRAAYSGPVGVPGSVEGRDGRSRHAGASEPVTGGVYLASQDENPFGSLIALYIVAENENEGVRVKIAGQVSLDPVTGQVVTTFENTPRSPYSLAKLQFFGTGQGAVEYPGVVRGVHDDLRDRTVVWCAGGDTVLHVPGHEWPGRHAVC